MQLHEALGNALCRANANPVPNACVWTHKSQSLVDQIATRRLCVAERADNREVSRWTSASHMLTDDGYADQGRSLPEMIEPNDGQAQVSSRAAI
jgi:hypothetical protein